MAAERCHLRPPQQVQALVALLLLLPLGLGMLLLRRPAAAEGQQQLSRSSRQCCRSRLRSQLMEGRMTWTCCRCGHGEAAQRYRAGCFGALSIHTDCMHTTHVCVCLLLCQPWLAGMMPRAAPQLNQSHAITCPSASASLLLTPSLQPAPPSAPLAIPCSFISLFLAVYPGLFDKGRYIIPLHKCL